MNEFVESVCPLCHSKAKCADYPAHHLKHFVCGGCKNVVLKYKAESWLAQAAAQPRSYYAAEAKAAPDGSALYMLQPRSSDPGVRFVEAKYLPLEEALQQ